MPGAAVRIASGGDHRPVSRETIGAIAAVNVNIADGVAACRGTPLWQCEGGRTPASPPYRAPTAHSARPPPKRTGDYHFEAQALIVEDPTISERAEALMTTEGMTAPAALGVAAEEQAAQLAAQPDPLWQARVANVRGVARCARVHARGPSCPFACAPHG